MSASSTATAAAAGPSSSSNTYIPSSPTSTTAATTGSNRRRRHSDARVLCRQQRQSLVTHAKPHHSAHMRARLTQLPASDEEALSADPEVLLELWHLRVDGEISLEGAFTPEEEWEAFQRRHRGEVGGEGEGEGGPVGGPLVAWGQGAGGSIFGGRLPDGPVADRSGTAGGEGEAHTRQHTRTARQQAEQDALLVGTGSWSEGHEAEQGERERAPLAIELGVEESTYPLIRAGPAA